jgi:hypothetical protein
MSLIETLLKKPNLTPASKYHALNGVIYFIAGLGLILWPRIIQVLLRDPSFTGHESALFRALGLTIAMIGWHYYFGGRTGGQQVVAASLIERFIYVPLVSLPLAIAGVFPHTFVAFAVLDVGLAIPARMLLRANAKHESFGTLEIPHNAD